MTINLDEIQGELPHVDLPLPTRQMRLLTELEIQTYRKRLIEADGDLEKSAISLEEMADIIYTCRHKANGMEESDAPVKEKKTKKEKSSVSTGKLSGVDINNLMG